MLLDKLYEVVVDGTELPVVNEKIFVLPNTGSSDALFMNLVGIWCVIKSLKKER